MSSARMQITFKLFATLGDYLPPEARFNQVTLNLAEGTRVAEVIDRHSLPPKLVHLVLVNGHFLPPPERTVRELKDGDVLAIWPPIAGG